jgi:hypothetical protein
MGEDSDIWRLKNVQQAQTLLNPAAQGVTEIEYR